MTPVLIAGIKTSHRVPLDQPGANSLSLSGSSVGDRSLRNVHVPRSFGEIASARILLRLPGTLENHYCLHRMRLEWARQRDLNSCGSEPSFVAPSVSCWVA